jgi:hypothetical protein
MFGLFCPPLFVVYFVLWIANRRNPARTAANNAATQKTLTQPRKRLTAPLKRLPRP